MENVKVFRDTIHGYIEIEKDIVSSIIDTALFQRLRRIEQTSMRCLYPAARHDRFIHSIGTFHLAKKISTNLSRKFQDLKNSIASGYVFDLEDFAKFDGKTGPYIQYAIARINSILRKAEEKNIALGNIVINTADERNLALKIAQLNAAVWRAHTEKEPSIISDYVYTLAQVFSTFYNSSPIMSAESPEIISSRLALAKLVRDILVKLLYLLGIDSPEVMLKKA